MPDEKPKGEVDAIPGLAGGPGPAPPGVEDGTPQPRAAAPEAPASADEQRREGEVSERTAGTRRADVPGLAGSREGRGVEQDADEEERERRTRR